MAKKRVKAAQVNPTFAVRQSKAQIVEAEYYQEVKDLSTTELAFRAQANQKEARRLQDEFVKLSEAVRVNRAADRVLAVQYQVLTTIITGRR